VLKATPFSGGGGARPERLPSTDPAEAMMTNDQRRQWLAHVKQQWLAGNLTDKGRIILIELATFTRCRFGVWPSHQLLARRARCCVRTVQTALREARAIGLLDWCHQRVEAAWRSLRTVNRYELMLPAGVVQSGPHGPGRTTGKACRGDIQPEKQGAQEGSRSALAAMLETARGLPDLLKARREAMEARWRRASGR
jgi:hypothetical protein